MATKEQRMGQQVDSTLFWHLQRHGNSLQHARPECISMLLDAVIALCHTKYWSRIWAVQELLLADDIQVVYQSHQVAWDKLWKGIDMITEIVPDQWVLHRASKSIDTSFAVRHCEARRRRAQLIAEDMYNVNLKDHVKYHLSVLLARYADTECTDHKDRIHAFLSLIENGDKVAVSYDEDVEKLVRRAQPHLCGCRACPRSPDNLLQESA